jgi:hypothetical protein
MVPPTPLLNHPPFFLRFFHPPTTTTTRPIRHLTNRIERKKARANQKSNTKNQKTIKNERRRGSRF